MPGTYRLSDTLLGAVDPTVNKLETFISSNTEVVEVAFMGAPFSSRDLFCLFTLFGQSVGEKIVFQS